VNQHGGGIVHRRHRDAIVTKGWDFNLIPVVRIIGVEEAEVPFICWSGESVCYGGPASMIRDRSRVELRQTPNDCNCIRVNNLVPLDLGHYQVSVKVVWAEVLERLPDQIVSSWRGSDWP